MIASSEVTTSSLSTNRGAVAQWLERKNGDWEVLGLNLTGAVSELWKFRLPHFASVFQSQRRH